MPGAISYKNYIISYAGRQNGKEKNVAPNSSWEYETVFLRLAISVTF